MVTLGTALEIFNEHDLQPSDRAMDVVEVIHCLTALYERLEEERGILVNVPLCVDMSLNWLLNVFDRYLSLSVPRAVGLPCLGGNPRAALPAGSAAERFWLLVRGAAWCVLALMTPLPKKPNLEHLPTCATSCPAAAAAGR